jgi:hypothetical protein
LPRLDLKPRLNHRDTLVETTCHLCYCSIMRIIYCCPIKLGGKLFNYTGFLSPHSFSLPLSCSLPFSLSVLGECQFLTPEAPLIAGKDPCMYNGHIHSKDDFRSPFVKPPWVKRGLNIGEATKDSSTGFQCGISKKLTFQNIQYNKFCPVL